MKIITERNEFGIVDLEFTYLIIVVLSILTFKKIKKLEKRKLRLQTKIKKEKYGV